MAVGGSPAGVYAARPGRTVALVHNRPAPGSSSRTCAAAGAIRTGSGPAELGADLEGIALTSASPQRRQRAERLLDLTLDGLKARP
ncbi:SbtR family transcriptional regulator [Streptomyces sp. NBC_00669]|uniref:SbtR family transcriptional regulator n=1 Tax=Streptomyces sp. NBC_00669 TaxID=2976011 RepID=UPI003FA69A1B